MGLPNIFGQTKYLDQTKYLEQTKYLSVVHKYLVDVQILGTSQIFGLAKYLSDVQILGTKPDIWSSQIFVRCPDIRT